MAEYFELAAMRDRDESISPSIGAVSSVTGASTTALSDWSAMIGGTTAFSSKSASTPATAREETRRITG
jgi:hypothetical protein